MILKVKSWSMIRCWKSNQLRSNHWSGFVEPLKIKLWVSRLWSSSQAGSNVDANYDRSFMARNKYKSVNWKGYV